MPSWFWKWAKWGALAFLVFYLLTEPEKSAVIVHKALEFTIFAFTQLGVFVSSL